MRRLLSPIFLLLVASASWALPSPGLAEGMILGRVEYVRVHDGETHPGWESPMFWFTLTGVSNLGSCPVWVGGRTLIAARSKEMLAQILSAQLLDKEVAVFYSDQVLLAGYCRARYVTTGNPPPPF
jgi:hypothetical protein